MVSELIKTRPLASIATETGLKQLVGQLPTFAFVMTSISAVVLVDGSTGSPLANLTMPSLYPIAGWRFPVCVGQETISTKKLTMYGEVLTASVEGNHSR